MAPSTHPMMLRSTRKLPDPPAQSSSVPATIQASMPITDALPVVQNIQNNLRRTFILRCHRDMVALIVDELGYKDARALSLTCQQFYAYVPLQPSSRWSKSDIMTYLNVAQVWDGNANRLACFAERHLRVLHKSQFADCMQRGGYAKEGSLNFKRICWDCCAALGRDGPFHHLAIIHKNKEQFVLCHECHRWSTVNDKCKSIPIRDENFMIQGRLTVCRPFGQSEIGDKSRFEMLPVDIQNRIVGMLSYQDRIMLCQANRHFRHTVDPQAAPLHEKFDRMQEQLDIYKNRPDFMYHPLFATKLSIGGGETATFPICTNCGSDQGAYWCPPAITVDVAGHGPVTQTQYGRTFEVKVLRLAMLCFGCCFEKHPKLRLPCYCCFKWKPSKCFTKYQMEGILLHSEETFWKTMCSRCVQATYDQGRAKPLDLEELHRRELCEVCHCLKYRNERCFSCLDKFGYEETTEGRKRIRTYRDGKKVTITAGRGSKNQRVALEEGKF
ncbi:hypothetical protein JX265_010909 [Neoarthrinium moseri]|uniref:F-box domain-containing protein n=1 Tax=Neoarthrinium moseri TaxID=1658444 RepID=A0A9Q0AKA1_9PEZI|nr:hypothetical protein JX265_010909 [Neoarthrinium moseri]